MSIINLLKSGFVICFGAFVGYTTVRFFSQPNTNNRLIASTMMAKLGSEHYAINLFDVRIKNENIAASSDEVSTISASVKAFKTLPRGLQFVWNLPESVTLVEGPTNGELDDFSANQKKEFRITVKGYSKQTRAEISFTIKGDLEGKTLDRSVLISSRPEDSFEFVVQQRERARANPPSGIGKKEKLSSSPIDPNKVSF